MVPAGAIQQLSLGNTLTEETCFNNIQQPIEMPQRRSGTTTCLSGKQAEAVTAEQPDDYSSASSECDAFEHHVDAARVGAAEPPRGDCERR